MILRAKRLDNLTVAIGECESRDDSGRLVLDLPELVKKICEFENEWRHLRQGAVSVGVRIASYEGRPMLSLDCAISHPVDMGAESPIEAYDIREISLGISKGACVVTAQLLKSAGGTQSHIHNEDMGRIPPEDLVLIKYAEDKSLLVHPNAKNAFCGALAWLMREQYWQNPFKFDYIAVEHPRGLLNF